MKKEVIYTKEAPSPIGPYSQAIRCGNMVFVSGQIPINPQSNTVYNNAEIEIQAELCLKNIQAVLATIGLKMDAIVKTTIFLTDMSNFTKVNDVYARFFLEDPPARSAIAVRSLPKDVGVEIEVIAMI